MLDFNIAVLPSLYVIFFTNPFADADPMVTTCSILLSLGLFGCDLPNMERIFLLIHIFYIWLLTYVYIKFYFIFFFSSFCFFLFSSSSHQIIWLFVKAKLVGIWGRVDWFCEPVYCVICRGSIVHKCSP